MKSNTWRKKYPSKKCKRCGKEFSRKYTQISGHFKKSVYCSRDCAGKQRNEEMRESFKKKYGPRKCVECGQSFQPNNQVHIYCGSKIEKTGCSYKNVLLKRAKYNSLYRMYGARRNWLNHTKIVR